MKLKNQSLLVKMSVGLTMIMFLMGLINSILSLLTFQNGNLRKVGCGIYLLASSITSLLTISMFTNNFWFILLTQMNSSFHGGGCKSIESLLKLCLYFDTWLNACVAIERAMHVYQSVRFNKEKSQRFARWIIFMLPFCITARIIHEPLHRDIFEHQCGNTSCSSLATTTERNVRRCQMTCLSTRLCEGASFHQSSSNCQLFSYLPNSDVNMLTNSDIYSMKVKSESRQPSEWIKVANMNVARESHTASILSNGKILVIGGFNGSSAHNSAELYDPSTNTWTMMANMSVGRGDHTATTLLNGKVLVVGGWHISGYINSVELYDPLTNNWTVVANITDARSVHTATLLSNGEVLVAGGDSTYSYLNSVELYDPSANTWTMMANMNVGRQKHRTVLLSSGKVLVVGGSNSDYLKSVELYDPSTNTWTTMADMNVAAEDSTATLLSSGKVLVAGGWNYNSTNSAQLYDLSTNTWIMMSNMHVGRSTHTATLLSSEKVLIIGGWRKSSPTNSVELLDPSINSWTIAATMNVERTSHTASLLLNGKILVVGGFNNGSLNSAELY
ncbi:unnamed protein product [Adineta steineri]|nr:unnamed protein product [Adineta steineri]